MFCESSYERNERLQRSKQTLRVRSRDLNEIFHNQLNEESSSLSLWELSVLP